MCLLGISNLPKIAGHAETHFFRTSVHTRSCSCLGSQLLDATFKTRIAKELAKCQVTVTTIIKQ